jgi:tyrosyl-tRNA synthetase
MAAPIDLLEELGWRGLIAEQSEGLAERLARGPISGYNGMDPTASSLHVGHLVPTMVLLHLQRAGHRPVAVVGGGTGMIGDPSGKSAERNLLDEETLERNVAGIRGQLERFLDFSDGSGQARLIDNREWLAEYTLIGFLRDIGKHFPLSYMLAKESVQTRLQTGVSFTEFSYMTLQAADFMELRRRYGVELQVGGTEQWGNITAGMELIRRMEGREEGADPLAYGLCFPLLLSPSGTKFGKTEKGTVWLAADRTSPYDFFQYWLNQDDRDVGMYLRRLTLFERGRIEALEAEVAARPGERAAQRELAYDITARVHGIEEAERQVLVAAAAFSGEPIRDPATLDVLYQNLDRFEFGEDDLGGDMLSLGVASGLYSSRSEARRAIQQGALSVDGSRVTDPAAKVPAPIGGRYLVLRSGKRNLRIGRRREG